MFALCLSTSASISVCACVSLHILYIYIFIYISMSLSLYLCRSHRDVLKCGFEKGFVLPMVDTSRRAPCSTSSLLSNLVCFTNPLCLYLSLVSVCLCLFVPLSVSLSLVRSLPASLGRTTALPVQQWWIWTAIQRTRSCLAPTVVVCWAIDGESPYLPVPAPPQGAYHRQRHRLRRA
jgi:hypothetical protein